MMLIHPCIWIFFREESLGKILRVFGQFPLSGSFDAYVIAMMAMSVFGLGAFILGLGGWVRDHIGSESEKIRAFEQLYWAAAILLIVIFARDTARDFIYFRF